MATPTRNSSAIQSLAGGEVWVSETDSTGSSYGAFAQLPYISGTNFSDVTSRETVSDEAGNTFYPDSSREVMFEVNTMQMDDDTMQWAVNDARGKYYGVLYKMTKNSIGGNHKWLFLGITTVDPEATRTSPGTEGPTYRFRVLVNDSAIATVDGSAADSNLSSIGISAGLYWDIIDSAT